MAHPQVLLSPGRVFHYNTKELYAWQCQENRKALTENLVIGQAIRAVQEGEKNGYGHAAMSHWQGRCSDDTSAHFEI